MILTEDNLKLFAAKYYDNPFCFSEEEFNIDLRRYKTISRLLTWDSTGYAGLNIRLFINNIISFYNVFEHKAATEILQLKIENLEERKKCNSVLYYLNLPLLDNGDYDIILHRKIVKEMKNV